MFKILIIVILFFPAFCIGEDLIFDDFNNNPAKRWEFIADSVMGGVSEGNVLFIKDENKFYAKMIGNVSLENNGGFIQFRRKIEQKLKDNLSGIKITVRGNGLEYYIHIRTKGTFLPWQYYQAPFIAQNSWEEIDVSFGKFERSGIMLSRKFIAKNITSIAIVAFGKNHKADIEVDNISFY